MPITLTEKIHEKSTKLLRLQFRYDEVPVPVSRIDTVTMTITVFGTTEIINGRSFVDVKSCFDSQGNFEFLLTADDNVIISTAVGLLEEVHLITFKIKTNDATPIYFNEDIQLTVLNLQMVGGEVTIKPAPARMVMTAVDPTVS